MFYPVQHAANKSSPVPWWPAQPVESEPPDLASLWGAATPLSGWLPAALNVLDDLRQLRDNWDGYNSKRITDAAAVATRRLLALIASDAPGAPTLKPTSLGGVDLVWGRGGRRLELMVEADGTLSYLTDDDYAEPHADDLSFEDSSTCHDLFRWFLLPSEPR